VLTESYHIEGKAVREIVLSADEAWELLQECLAAIMREISSVRMI
jgi:hypothetical protein